MKEAHCYIAYFGIESGSDRVRNTILGKNISREQIKDTARLLRKYKIKIGTFNMVGMPGETFEDAWETVKLNQEIRSDYPWCSIIQPYPGTDFEKQAKLTGHLDDPYGVNHLQQSYFNTTVIKNPEASALVRLQKMFYLAVKYPSLSSYIRKVAQSQKNEAVLKWIFNITYAYRYSKTYRIPFLRLLRQAILWKANY
jgi:anaerobic magnesium-protoporphyrin IX monomethyl ester cyclase